MEGVRERERGSEPDGASVESVLEGASVRECAVGRECERVS